MFPEHLRITLEIKNTKIIVKAPKGGNNTVRF